MTVIRNTKVSDLKVSNDRFGFMAHYYVRISTVMHDGSNFFRQHPKIRKNLMINPTRH